MRICWKFGGNVVKIGFGWIPLGLSRQKLCSRFSVQWIRPGDRILTANLPYPNRGASVGLNDDLGDPIEVEYGVWKSSNPSLSPWREVKIMRKLGGNLVEIWWKSGENGFGWIPWYCQDKNVFPSQCLMKTSRRWILTANLPSASPNRGG